MRGDIGKRVRLVRRLSGMRVRDVAEVVGKLPITVYRWEIGKSDPCLDDCRLIAIVAGVSLAWLVTGEGEARAA